MVSSVLILDAGMLRYRYHEFDISFTNNDVRAIKVDSTPRLSYLRNQMVSSVLILGAGMLRYRYHEFDILEYLIR